KRSGQLLSSRSLRGRPHPHRRLGPALGQHGVNIMGFVKEYNSKTANQKGNIVPVAITVFEDRSFTFVTKTSPASDQLRRAAGVERGSAAPRRENAGRVTVSQVREIARNKLDDLNSSDVESAVEMIKGTARSMGIEVVEG
ncbi:50S ribosomal protein L11, partial [Geodia barretti]